VLVAVENRPTFSLRPDHIMQYALRKRSMADALGLVTKLYVTKYYALGPKQRSQLQKYHTEVWKYYAIPEGMDGHFQSCWWGQGATEGPDTCECCFLSFTIRDLEKLAEEIKNIPDDPVLQ
jgi:hypothetical protein